MRSLSTSGLAAALAASMSVAPLHRDDYPHGYRAKRRAKPANLDKKAKRKSQRRARMITRNKRK